MLNFDEYLFYNLSFYKRQKLKHVCHLNESLQIFSDIVLHVLQSDFQNSRTIDDFYFFKVLVPE